MIALPWYLLAASLLLVVIGFIWANVAAPPRRKPISHKMSDAEIARSLSQEERMSSASIVILLGFVGIGISLVWRLVLRFL
jgi:hypothetical protein